MLRDTIAVFSFSVDDIAKAERFFSDQLGLRTTREGSDEYWVLWLHLASGPPALVYPKPDHIPASCTLLNFVVDDIDAVVDDLVSRGVRFMRYDELGADGKGIVRSPDRDMAWFTDPAGNNHSLARPKTPQLLQQLS